ncbi:hypothetical protein [Streptomyces apocyni]|uniref:hypothetical protein n=1 Tax=Streptomyces apocyni TaxID=2654677 RepID=UPI0012EAFBC9|nr:hypothetical protein [Streptomyces apocyni]
MASRDRGFDELGCFGAFLALGFAEVLYQVVAVSWRRGEYGPAVILAALVAAVVVTACAVWWVREFGIAIWNRRRERQQKRHRAD